MAKQIDDIVSLDPAEAYEISDAEAIGNVYDRLLDYDPAHPETIEAALASSWSVDPDGRTFTFVLRDDARFASGRPVTAGDAAFSLQRAVTLDMAPAFVLRQSASPRTMSRAADPRRGATTLVIETAVKVAPSLLYYCLTSLDRLGRRQGRPRWRISRTAISAINGSPIPFGRHRGPIACVSGGRANITCSKPMPDYVGRQRPRTARSSCSTSPSPRRSGCCWSAAMPITRAISTRTSSAALARDKDDRASTARVQSRQTYLALNQRTHICAGPR